MNITDTMAGPDLQALRAAVAGQVPHHPSAAGAAGRPSYRAYLQRQPCRFGSQLDHYPFVAKADLRARAIENAPPRPFPGLRRDIMHPMFKELFIDTDADDLAAEQDRRRRVRRSRRARPAMIVRPAPPVPANRLYDRDTTARSE
jgi:hypothetical protein